MSIMAPTLRYCPAGSAYVTPKRTGPQNLAMRAAVGRAAAQHQHQYRLLFTVSYPTSRPSHPTPRSLYLAVMAGTTVGSSLAGGCSGMGVLAATEGRGRCWGELQVRSSYVESGGLGIAERERDARHGYSVRAPFERWRRLRERGSKPGTDVDERKKGDLGPPTRHMRRTIEHAWGNCIYVYTSTT
ncbi:hypothetical protein BDV95DRAFT_556363 [Massariosphaeria phaeospora]|uniref:Uncharacterized protein n=1 Tax=Massariosphaeria phaeospora TaxID=100035 RepID=A0A7C8IEX7_9PLEO|nr:hypothetical protein BDV95DRAFT_556363 [Massariosphaeria phaeospora]